MSGARGWLLTQDPIGLAGGVNLYSYAGSNPIAFDDPFGLCIWDGCVVEAMVIGMATFGGIRTLANVVSGRPVTENVAMDMVVGATAGVTAGGSALLQGASSTPARYVIGALDDITAQGAIKAGEATLLPRLAGDLGSRAANWARNEAALRDVMALGRPIRDASIGLLRGLKEFGPDRFITLERDVLRGAGWVYSRWTGTWSPPSN